MGSMTEKEKIENMIFGRETSSLGGIIGSRCVSVGVQCEIKIAAKYVRDMQKTIIEMRIDNAKLNRKIDKLVK